MLREHLGARLRRGGWRALTWSERVAVGLTALLLVLGVVSGAVELRRQGRAREVLAQTKAARMACTAVASQRYAQGLPFADESGPGGFAPGVQEEIQQLGALPGTVHLLRTDEEGVHMLALLYLEDGYAGSFDESDGGRVWRTEERIHWTWS